MLYLTDKGFQLKNEFYPCASLRGDSRVRDYTATRMTSKITDRMTEQYA